MPPMDLLGEKKKITDLPWGLVEEVISRVPITSLRKVRLTCKRWNEEQKKVAPKEKKFMVVMMMEFKLCLMSLDFNKDNIETCIKREGEIISLDGSDLTDVHCVFHGNGLLLCVRKDNGPLVVWNPHLGKTRWIKPTRDTFHRYTYAIGYTKCHNNHKILKFGPFPEFSKFEIYDLSYGPWRDLDHVTPDCVLYPSNPGLSLKGNTYWFATKGFGIFLVSFDYTQERLGPRLHVPFHWADGDTMNLSSVRDEQLAVLFQRRDTKMMEIWVTTRIEPDAVSWSTKVFLAVDTKPLIHYEFQFIDYYPSFFINEEKKVVMVVTHTDTDKMVSKPTRVGYIFRVDGSFNRVHLGESTCKYYPLMCPYVPSLVQLN